VLKIAHQYAVEFDYTVITTGQISGKFKTLFGCVDGKVRVFDSTDNEEEILETKGGAIQAMVLHNLSQFGLDLITADSNGHVVVFNVSTSQMLFQTSVAFPVTCLCVDIDLNAYARLIVGDMGGTLTGFQIHEPTLWRVRMEEEPAVFTYPSIVPIDYSIRSMVSINMPNTVGVMTHYLLVASGTPHVHFYAQDIRVLSLATPSIVNTMCVGYFDESDGKNESKDQVALGCENGFIYILKNFSLHTYADVQRTVTKLSPVDAAPSYTPPAASALLCVGHFNALLLYHKRQLICEKIVPSWVQTLYVNNGKEITLGLNNKAIQSFNVEYKSGTENNTGMQFG